MRAGSGIFKGPDTTKALAAGFVVSAFVTFGSVRAEAADGA